MKKLLLPVAVACLCISCAPPFDLGFSAAAVIIGKMTKESQLGPLTNYHVGWYSSQPAFYPEKTATGVDATRGFYLTTDVGNSIVALGFVQPDGTGGYTAFDTGIGSLYRQDSNYPTFTLVPVKSGDFGAVLGLDSQNPSNSALIVLQSAAGTFTAVNSVSFSALSGYASVPQAVGAWISPTATGSDTLYFLVRDASTGQFREGMDTIDSTGVGGTYGYVYAYGPDTFGFMPASATRVMYYHDPNPASNVSYASFYAGGTWQCWKWWYTGAGVLTSVQLTGVNARVDALLTTGELFSAQDGIGRVYDSGGKKLASFPLGNLTFACEAYVNGMARVFFSMPMVQEEDHVSFAVYSIATSDMKTLSF